MLNDQEINQLIIFSMLFIFQPDCIGNWEFVILYFIQVDENIFLLWQKQLYITAEELSVFYCIVLII